MSGMERHPSSALSLPDVSRISGLMRTSGSPSISITARRSVRPTWGAASPIPRAWCIVSNMSATSARRSSLISFTGTVFWRRIGSPRTRMSRMLTGAGSLLRCHGCARPADDARDLAALDDEPRLRRFDRDLILHRARRGSLAGGQLLDVHHLAHDPAERDDLIAALDGAQRRFVLLPLLGLRADEEEVEDRQDQRDLDQERRERSEAAAAGLQDEERWEDARVHHAGAGMVREW